MLVNFNLGTPYIGVWAWDDGYFETDEEWIEEVKANTVEEALKIVKEEFRLYDYYISIKNDVDILNVLVY